MHIVIMKNVASTVKIRMISYILSLVRKDVLRVHFKCLTLVFFTLHYVLKKGKLIVRCHTLT